MNFKRGLTRLYFVAWVLFGLAGLFLVWEKWTEAGSDAATVEAYLRANHGVPLQRLQELKPEDWSSGVDTTGTMDPDSIEPATPWDLRYASMAAQSEDFQHPVRVRARILGLWLLVCGIAPAVLLVTIRWIAAGFAKT